MVGDFRELAKRRTFPFPTGRSSIMQRWPAAGHSACRSLSCTRAPSWLPLMGGADTFRILMEGALAVRAFVPGNLHGLDMRVFDCPPFSPPSLEGCSPQYGQCAGRLGLVRLTEEEYNPHGRLLVRCNRPRKHLTRSLPFFHLKSKSFGKVTLKLRE